MFQSAGLFRDVSCPYYIFGLCERPYCHFKHSKHDEAKVKATLSQATATTADSTSRSEDDKYTLPTNALERTLKDVEANIKSEKNKLKGKSLFDSSTVGQHKPAVKTKPTGTPQYNPTPITELKKHKKQKKQTDTGLSKYDLALLDGPSSEQEYDPASNFTASFKGTVADVPEYAAGLHGNKRSADDDEKSESPVAKIPKFVSVEYTPAVTEPVFSDDETVGDKEGSFSEEESCKDSASELGDKEPDLQNNQVDSASDNSELSKSESVNVSKDILPFEFTPEGFIKVPVIETSSVKTKPKDKTSENTKVENNEASKTESSEIKLENVKKDDSKNIFSLFMAAAESVLSKTSGKVESKSEIDELYSAKNIGKKEHTETDLKTVAERSSLSGNGCADRKVTSESHLRREKSSESKSDRKSEKIRSANNKDQSCSHEKERKRNSSADHSFRKKSKSYDSNKTKHLKHDSKDVADKGVYESFHSKTSDRHSSKLSKLSKENNSSHLNKKSDRTSDGSVHLNHSSKNRDKKSSDKTKSEDHHIKITHSKHSESSPQKVKGSVNKNVTSEEKLSSVSKNNPSKPLNHQRRKSSDKVKTLVKTRKIVDLNVDLFGADSDTESKDKVESARDDNVRVKGKKKLELDTDINHYDDSDLDLDNLDLNKTSPDAENEFSDLEKYFSDEDPFDECLRIFNEEGPSTAGPEKKKLKKKETENVPESSSGKKRIGMKASDPNEKKHTLADKPVPKMSPAQVMMNRYKMMQQKALEAQEKEKEKMKQKVRKISAQNAMNATSTSSKSVADASAKFSNYLANKNKPSPKKTTAITVTKGQKRKAHTPTVPVEKLKRPVVEVSTSSKVPTNIRQRYLNLMIDECLKLYKSEKEAFQRAREEEEAVYTGVSNKNIYLNKAVNTIKRLRTEIENKASTSKDSSGILGKMSHEAMLDGAQAAKTTFTLHRSGGAVKVREEDFTGIELYKRLEPYILTEDQLKENNFPRPDPTSGGMAVFYGEDIHAQKARTKGYEKVCVRCGKIFEVYPNGKYPKKEECVYHWGKAFKKRIAGALETRYSCCSGDLGSEGCQVCKAHVHETNKRENLSGYMKTIPCSPPPGGDFGVYALDCEMVYTTQGMELARVTVVGSDLEPIYESLVKPVRPVVDCNTRFSGITEEDLEDVTTGLRDVQAVLLSLFNDKTILVGHSLESDLAALKLIHGTVVDTSMVFPHRMGLPYKRALKNLMAEYLKKIIQDDVAGHDSHEDAISCLQLMQFKLKEDARKEGRR